MLAFTVVIALGISALTIDFGAQPERRELHQLQTKIDHGPFTGYTLSDLRRRRELEREIRSASMAGLGVSGFRLVHFGLWALASVSFLIALQSLFRWLWLGKAA
jgi:hypothetical protein